MRRHCPGRAQWSAPGATVTSSGSPMAGPQQAAAQAAGPMSSRCGERRYQGMQQGASARRRSYVRADICGLRGTRRCVATVIDLDPRHGPGAGPPVTQLELLALAARRYASREVISAVVRALGIDDPAARLHRCDQRCEVTAANHRQEGLELLACTRAVIAADV